jgi:hypothetical protein
MSSSTPEGTQVTALHFDEPAVADDLAAWCGGEVAVPEDAPDDVTILVPDLNGPRPARIGDWIVLEPEGHFRPYTPLAFAARFEPSV